MPHRCLDVAIRPISAEHTRNLRHLVLWPTLGINEQLLPYDHISTTIHLGAFLDSSSGLDIPTIYLPHEQDTQQPVAVLTLVEEPYSLSETLPGEIMQSRTKFAIQLRKFAVLHELQGYGVGRRLLDAALQHLQHNAATHPLLLHLDARVNQVGFYERCGMVVLDSSIFVKRGATGTGPPVEHIRMGKVVRA